MRAFLAVVLVCAVAACGSRGENSDAAEAVEVVSTASDCAGLVEELDASAAPTMGVGDTCSVGASNEMLERLGLASNCPTDASIIVPFTRSSRGWYLDEDALRQVDNGDCTLAEVVPHELSPASGERCVDILESGGDIADCDRSANAR